MTAINIKHNPFKIVQMFEEEVAEYTGAPYAVAVDSCTNALFLACTYAIPRGSEVTIPSKTYLSVPMSIIHAGSTPVFNTTVDANSWRGGYRLDPYNVWDCAKMLTSGMYIKGQHMCLSFHAKKNLPIGKGGMILTDNEGAYNWFKYARYEGRSEKNYRDDDILEPGWNMYMTPEEAARGLTLMQNYPAHAEYISEFNGYRDLTEFTLFKNYPHV